MRHIKEMMKDGDYSEIVNHPDFSVDEIKIKEPSTCLIHNIYEKIDCCRGFPCESCTFCNDPSKSVQDNIDYVKDKLGLNKQQEPELWYTKLTKNFHKVYEKYCRDNGTTPVSYGTWNYVVLKREANGLYKTANMYCALCNLQNMYPKATELTEEQAIKLLSNGTPIPTRIPERGYIVLENESKELENYILQNRKPNSNTTKTGKTKILAWNELEYWYSSRPLFTESKQSINNNLNNKTDGKSIITKVERLIPRVFTGTRPTGTRIPSRARQATTVSRPISNTASIIRS
jgi:hypothetical protein